MGIIELTVIHFAPERERIQKGTCPIPEMHRREISTVDTRERNVT